MRFSEFEDDEQLSTFESLVCQQGTRECLMAADTADADRAKLQEVMELCEVPLSEGKKSSFSEQHATQVRADV